MENCFFIVHFAIYETPVVMLDISVRIFNFSKTNYMNTIHFEWSGF